MGKKKFLCVIPFRVEKFFFVDHVYICVKVILRTSAYSVYPITHIGWVNCPEEKANAKKPSGQSHGMSMRL